MACIIFKILLMVFVCLFFITFVAKDAIAVFFIDETILDEKCYSSLEEEDSSNDICIFPEESPMAAICHLIQVMYNVISIVWSLFIYFGCVTWKIVSFNPCLSFLIGIAFTFLVLVKAPKSFSFMANQNKKDDKSNELLKDTMGAVDNARNVENEVLHDSSVEEELCNTDDTGKPESLMQPDEMSFIDTNETNKNEDYISVSSAGIRKEEASHVSDVSRKKRKISRNEKLMKDFLCIKELEEKLEKQITELFNELAGLRNEVVEIRINGRRKNNEFDICLENAINQIRTQGNKFFRKSVDYTKAFEKLESNINTKIISSENLKQLSNGFPTEEDVVKWLHSSLCPLIGSKDFYLSLTPRERRCFSIISRSPLACGVSCKFSDMIVTLDNN